MTPNLDLALEPKTYPDWRLADPATLPTMYDLPSEDPEEPGMPDEFHVYQPQLLTQTFRPPGYPLDQVFAAIDMNLYYDVTHTRRYKRPDWFGVVGVAEQVDQGRLSYVIWHERVAPLIVIELLSPSTIEEDQGNTPRGQTIPSKWEVYEQILKIPYYVLSTRMTTILEIFELNGSVYQKLPRQTLWIPSIQLGLGLWEGEYHRRHRQWLRWYDAEGQWILTPEEQERQRAETERQRAETERQRAETERQRAETEQQRASKAEAELDHLRQRLRELGVDP